MFEHVACAPFGYGGVEECHLNVAQVDMIWQGCQYVRDTLAVDTHVKLKISLMRKKKKTNFRRAASKDSTTTVANIFPNHFHCLARFPR